MSQPVEPDSMGDATRGTNGSALPVVDRLLEEARDRLSLRSGGAPLCSTTPAGTPGPGTSLKSLEGAVVALTRLRRSVLNETAEPAGAIAERCLQAWQSENDDRHGSTWAGYTEGGVRALKKALEELDRTSTGYATCPESRGLTNPRLGSGVFHPQIRLFQNRGKTCKSTLSSTEERQQATIRLNPLTSWPSRRHAARASLLLSPEPLD